MTLSKHDMKNPSKRAANKIQGQLVKVNDRYCAISPFEIEKKDTHRRIIAKIADPSRKLNRTKLTWRMRVYLWRHCRNLATKNLKVRALRKRLAELSREENALWHTEDLMQGPYEKHADAVAACEDKNRKERELIVGIIGTIFYKDPIQCLRDN
jgi:hypothetical protein